MAKVESAVLTDASVLGALQMNALSSDYFSSMFPARDGIGEEYCTTGWRRLLQQLETSQNGLYPKISVVRDNSGMHGIIIERCTIFGNTI